MKKTLKRIIAAVAALPIAAYSVPAFAVEVADAPLAAQTAASAVLIDVTAEDMTAIRESQYTCEWNLLITAGLWCCTDTTCEMDVSALYDTVIANAGAYAGFAEKLFACVEGETLNYSNGVFDISASIPSALAVLADANGTSLSEQLQNAGADLSALDMSGLDIPCTINIKADFQNTGAARTISLSYGIQTADGTYTLAGENSFQSYFAEKFDAFAASVNALTADTDAAAAVQAILADTAAKISAADVAADIAMNKQAVVTGATLNDALTQIEASYPEYADKIPASAETIAQVLESGWNSLFTQINANVVPEGGEINLDVHEVAAIFDSLTNVTLTLENGCAKISGTLEDDQTDAVKAYYANNAAALAALAQSAVQAGDGDATGLSAYAEGMTLEDTAKVVEASLPLTMLESGSGELYYNVYRTYTFSAPTETEPAATETTLSSSETEVTETSASEETTVSEATETEVTETSASEETTVSETTEAVETSASEETTVSEATETEVSETSASEETTVSETTEAVETSASEETTVSEATETEVSETSASEETTVSETTEAVETSASEETTVSEATEEETETTAASSETESTETDEEYDCDEEDGRRHCGRRHRHRRHHDQRMRPEWNWKDGPKWDWSDCHDWDEFQDWEWVECPGDEECPYWEHVDKPDWNWDECPDWEWIDCSDEDDSEDCMNEERRHGGRRECFTDFKEMFGEMDGMRFEGGMPCISLNNRD